MLWNFSTVRLLLRYEPVAVGFDGFKESLPECLLFHCAARAFLFIPKVLDLNCRVETEAPMWLRRKVPQLPSAQHREKRTVVCRPPCPHVLFISWHGSLGCWKHTNHNTNTSCGALKGSCLEVRCQMLLRRSLDYHKCCCKYQSLASLRVPREHSCPRWRGEVETDASI